MGDWVPLHPIRESPPCKDCHSRRQGFHDSCKSYLSWKQEIQRVDANRRKYNQARRLEKNPRFDPGVCHRGLKEGGQ